MKLKYKISKSCKTISVFNFFEIVSEKDLRYLIKGFDIEDNDIGDLSKYEKKILDEVFSNILYEYGDLSLDTSLKLNYKNRIFIAELEHRYKIAAIAFKIFLEHQLLEAVNILEQLNFNIDLSKELSPQIIKVENQLKGLKNRINIHKIKFNKKFEKKLGEKKMNLDKEALILEKNLDLKYAIDTKTTMLAKWISMVNLSKTIKI